MQINTFTEVKILNILLNIYLMNICCIITKYNFCEAQARVRQGSDRQGMAPKVKGLKA